MSKRPGHDELDVAIPGESGKTLTRREADFIRNRAVGLAVEKSSKVVNILLIARLHEPLIATLHAKIVVEGDDAVSIDILLQ